LNETNQYIQPDIPYLYEFFKIFCSNVGADGIFHQNRYVQDGTFVPNVAPLAANGGLVRIGGHPFHVSDGANPPVLQPILAAEFPVLMNVFNDVPVPDSAERYNETFRFWTQSQFRAGGPAAAQVNLNPTTLADMFRMPDGKMNWFTECINAATTFSKYFHGTTNLGALDVFSGADVGIYSHVRINANDRGELLAGNQRHDVVPVPGTIPFHPMVNSQSTASIYWYEERVKDYHRWTARHTTTNARIEIAYRFDGNDVNVDALATPAAAQPNAPRHGPFYNTHEDNSRYEHQILGAHGYSAAPIHVYDGRYDMIQQHFYSSKGEGKANF